MLRRFLRYLEKVFHFSASLDHLKDGRHHPFISAQMVFYCVFLLFVLRLGSLNGLEAHYRSRERKWRWAASLGQFPPSADTLGYSLMRFDCETLRELLHGIYTRLQRNHLIGQIRSRGWLVLAVDGHELFSSYLRCCEQCSTRRIHTAQGERIQYYHRVVVAQLLGGSFAIPHLLEDAKGIFAHQEPVLKQKGPICAQWWDEEGFASRPERRGPFRVVRSLEAKQKGRQFQISDWYWCTTLPKAIVPTETVCRIGHMRWEIENQGLNVLVNYYNLDHCFKHHPKAIVAFALICCLAYILFQMFYYRLLIPSYRN